MGVVAPGEKKRKRRVENKEVNVKRTNYFAEF